MSYYWIFTINHVNINLINEHESKENEGGMSMSLIIWKSDC